MATRASSLFFFNDTATTEIYTLSLHDALPIWCSARSRGEANARGLRGVLRGGPLGATSRRQRTRRPLRRLEWLQRPRLRARPRHWPLDRDDDDRVPEDRRGSRDRARREHGLLDAPPRHLRRRPRVSLYA